MSYFQPFIFSCSLLSALIIGENNKEQRNLKLEYGCGSQTATPYIVDSLPNTAKNGENHSFLLKLVYVLRKVWYHMKEIFILFLNTRREIFMISIDEFIH